MGKNRFFKKQAKKLFIVMVAVMSVSYINGQTLVGALPGSIDVSPTGTATYAIPIEVVPGTAGMQPNLSIVYNSQAGNGSLGMKWDLAGLSAITRVGQTMYFDNNVTGVNLNSNDKFALDGSRLIVTNNGIYGADETQYATEVENFSRVTSYNTMGNGPEYFKMITDDGTTIEYGNTNDSRLVLDGTVHTWMISKITDIHDNYMVFEYTLIDRMLYINKIKYTGNTTANPALVPYAEVSFTYQSKTNDALKPPLYINRYYYKQSQLLQKINVLYGNSVVREYYFSYTENNRYVRLTKIDLKIDGSNVLEPTIITWGTETPLITSTSIQRRSKKGCTLVGDFNGDGIPDFLYYNQLVGTQTNTVANDDYEYSLFYGGNKGTKTETIKGFLISDAFAADINGDGKDEFIYTLYTDAERKLYWRNFENNTQYLICSNFVDIRLGDFNGDGKIDIIFTRYPEYDKSKKHFYLLTDISQDPVLQSMTLELADKFYTCNFNGDGKTDLMVSNANGIIVYECSSTSSYFSILHQPPSHDIDNKDDCFFGDFNGDGISDIVLYIKNANIWRLYLGTGTSLDTWASYVFVSNLSLATPASNGGYQLPIIADFDGDGKDDIIQVVNSTNNREIRIYLTRKVNNDGQYPSNNYFCDYSQIISGWYPSNKNFTVGDMNSDGKMDLIYMDSAYISFYKDEEFALVKKITDGMGVENELKYTYFTKYNSSIKKWLPYPVVSELWQSNGIGNNTTPTTFKYLNPEFSYKRRCFMGFRSFSIEKDGYETFHEFEKNNTYEMLCLNKVTIRKVGNYTTAGTVSQRIFVPEFLYFPSFTGGSRSKRFLMYHKTVVDWDEINQTHTRTERYLYSQENFRKGRDSLVMTLTANGTGYTDDYELKTTKEITYLNINANGKMIVHPFNIVTKDSVKGSKQLEKSHTVNYRYIPGTHNIDYIKVLSGVEDKLTNYSNYNAYGVPCKTFETPSNVAYYKTTLYTYDDKGRFILQEKSQNTDVVNYTYDNKTGNVLSVTDINNLTTTYQYDKLGRKIKTVYPDGTRDSIAFVSGGHGFENCAYQVLLFSTGKGIQRIFYDKLGRELISGTINLSFTDTKYDYFGRVVKKSLPYKSLATSDNEKTWQIYAYDTLGRLISEKGPYTDICYTYKTEIIYNPNPNFVRKVTAYDKLRQVYHTKTFDAVSRLKSSTDDNGIIKYDYSLQEYNGKVCDKTEISAFDDPKRKTTIITDQWGNRLKLSDPDAGEIISTYNGWGQVLTQTDANGTQTSYTYDGFGRKTQITMSNGGQTSTIAYTYDVNNKKGTLSSETMQPDNTSITYTYDKYIRLESKTYKDITNDRELAYFYNYNKEGQLDTVKYPYNFAIKHRYDSYGRLITINRVGNHTGLIYNVNYFSKWNTPQFWELGNAVGTEIVQNEAGLLTNKFTGIGSYKQDGIGLRCGESTQIRGGESMQTRGGIEDAWGTQTPDPGGNGGVVSFFSLNDSTIQHQEYAYDNAGRMTMRARYPILVNNNWEYKKKEYFTHDKSDRLTNALSATLIYNPFWGPQNPPIGKWVSLPQNLFDIDYNQNLMTSNSAVGEYTYDQDKPHALKYVDLHPENENTISLHQCDLTYTAFNKVDSIHEGDYAYKILYYPNQQKAVTILSENNTETERKIYADKTFEQVGNKKYFYVYAYGQPIAVFIQDGSNAAVPYYIHTDHLGSIDVITDANGTIVDSMSFDAWGNRRDRWNWTQKETGVTHLIDRGFTDHQHLDVFELINMGGRVYDPVVGQFLSPDPYVQAPDNTQNLNRYAYCLFSPLQYTDPTGEWYEDDWYLSENGDLIWQPSKLQILDINGIRYRNIGECVSIQIDDYLYMNYYQNIYFISDQAFNAKQYILDNDMAYQFIGTESKLWEGAKSDLFNASMQQGQRDFMMHPATQGTIDVMTFIASGGITGIVSLGKLGWAAISKLMTKEGTTVLEGAVKSNYGRFVKNMPVNAKSSASFQRLNDGNYLFQATSPGNVPGSSALYQKWVNPQGETFKMIKTTFAPDGSIIHIKPKF